MPVEETSRSLLTGDEYVGKIRPLQIIGVPDTLAGEEAQLFTVTFTMGF